MADLDRAKGALIGLAVGDALGTTLEFSRRDSLPPVTDLVGGGPFRLAPGEWTDDTSMALCLADSLLACRGLEPANVMSQFLNWRNLGHNSVNGICFDIGTTTLAALTAFERNGNPFAGRSDPNAAGNGSIMRLAPTVIAAGRDIERAQDWAAVQSQLTHAAEEAVDACVLMATILHEAIHGAEIEVLLRPRTIRASPRIAELASGAWRGKARAQISSSGYVVHTLEAALWALGNSSGFRDAVLLAVNLGDDADSVGAVTGQLAGAAYGLSGMPREWVQGIAWSEAILTRAADLHALGRALR